jgi:hypothetical protein
MQPKENTLKLLDAIFALKPPAKTRTIFRDKIGSSRVHRKPNGVVIEACIPVLLREQVIESVDSIIGGPHAAIGSPSSFLDLAVYSGDARAVKAVLYFGKSERRAAQYPQASPILPTSAGYEQPQRVGGPCTYRARRRPSS